MKQMDCYCHIYLFLFCLVFLNHAYVMSSGQHLSGMANYIDNKFSLNYNTVWQAVKELVFGRAYLKMQHVYKRLVLVPSCIFKESDESATQWLQPTPTFFFCKLSIFNDFLLTTRQCLFILLHIGKPSSPFWTDDLLFLLHSKRLRLGSLLCLNNYLVNLIKAIGAPSP